MDFANTQIALFEKLSSKLLLELQIKPLRHILNTSGMQFCAQYDMVRLGIDCTAFQMMPKQKQLENVGTLKSIISQIRTISAGESVGYGRRFVANKPTTATIGYAWNLEKLGQWCGTCYDQNNKAQIVGSVCMDMLMIDVTGINCHEGDVVVVFGKTYSELHC
jgi:alanine racemase